MPVERGPAVELPAEVLHGAIIRQGGGASGMEDEIAQAAREATELAEPAVAWEVLPVQAVGEHDALLGKGTRLTLGPHAGLLAPAREAFVWVQTIGPRLEARVGALSAEGDALAAYLLDAAGVVVLGLAGQSLTARIEERARQRGWGVGARLAPGSLPGWPHREQSVLYGLVPAADIGVRITPGRVLVPHKSAAGLVGLGPDYPAQHVGSICHLCNLRATCWRRRHGGEG